LLKTLNRKSDFVKENTSIRMVANRIKDAEEGENLHQKLSVVVEKFLNIKVEYLGGILNDANCQKAVMQQDPVMLSFPNSNTASAIQKIAAKLIDVQLDNDDKSGIAHLFNRWMKTIYKKKKG
jgi:flagellar biosynthesis protein FlhG